MQRTDVCLRCYRQLGARGWVSQYCGSCAQHIDAIVHHFQRDITVWLQRGNAPTGEYWDTWIAHLQQHSIPVHEAHKAIKQHSVNYLERYVSFAYADGIITHEEVTQFQRDAAQLGVPLNEVHTLWTRMQRGVILSEIRAGNLPRATSSIHLEVDELCYLDEAALYIRTLKTRTQEHSGKLSVSNKKIRFTGYDHSWESGWKKILGVAPHADTLCLQTSHAAGMRFIRLRDPEYASTVIETALHIDRRKITTRTRKKDTAHVPQHIKTEVWQRDHGECVECGSSSYLEFDHIIPRSKGGATSLKNLQLLCRRCNLRKGNRV